MEEQLLFIYFFLDIFVSYIVSIIFIVNLTKSVNMCVVVNTGERLASASLALHHTHQIPELPTNDAFTFLGSR